MNFTPPLQRPAGQAELGERRLRQGGGDGAGALGFVPEGEEFAGGDFNGGGVADVAFAVVGDDDGLRPGLAVVAAEAGVVATGVAAVAVGHDEAAVGEAEEVAGEAPDADGAGGGPGFAAVGGFRLEGFAVVGGVLVADVGDQAAVGGLDGVEFVVVDGGVAGTRGDFGEPAPGEAIVGGFADADFGIGVPKAFAGVEKAAVAESDGAVRAVDGDAVGGGPVEAAIGGAEHPGAEEGLAFRRGGGALHALPAFDAGGVPALGFGEDFFVGEGGKGRHEERAARGFDDAGVAVVNGGIHDDLRPAPGLAVVLGAAEFDAAEGVDVAFAAAGVGDDEFAVGAAGHGGPGVIVLGLFGDDGDEGGLEEGAAVHC